LRVDTEEITIGGKRILVFHVPSRPLGMPLHKDGRYLMRSGESLVAMSPDQLQRIFAETGPDYSAEICPNADVNDLDEAAINVFRDRWYRKSGIPQISTMEVAQLLEDSELTTNGCLTYAALILLGTHKAMGRHLAQAEVIWEFRSTQEQIPSNKRLEFRRGFLTYHNELWNQINAYNSQTSVREGLFRRDIPTFNEDAVREAVLNAVCHRDYRFAGSIFTKQFPKRLEVTSPGGLPQGITLANILERQSPRNRRLAVACERCGLVERSCQGMDRIYDTSLREGKGLPDFTGTDEHEVVLSMRGEVIDAPFLQLMNHAENHGITLSVRHLRTLDSIQHSHGAESCNPEIVRHLIDIGLVERVGRGKSGRLILSRGMYGYLGEPGSYKRYKGLDRETNKELLLKHIRTCGKQGANLFEFRQVLPQLTDGQIRYLVDELRKDGLVIRIGWANTSRWIPAELA
jgi:ATP-dependent DNA helicase RecG